MWIEREIQVELKKAAKAFPVVVLVGPRQVGKTALVENTFPEMRYVSLDLPATAGLAESLPESFLEQYPPPVVIDEVQYAPGLFRYLKTVVDHRRDARGQFILTGSQNFVLMEDVSDSLAGRAAVIPLIGLSGTEWRNGPGKDSNWIDFLWRGNFPELWADPDTPPDRDRWYQGYVSTYLERDVRNLLNVGSLRDFERFLRACAARCGQRLNMSDLGRDVGISPSTARQWISVLQASNIVFLLEPYFRSLGKRLVKSPKLYFTDTGLAAFLMGFQSPSALWSSQQSGALWETHVIGQWLRWRDWHQPSAGLWYWSDRSGSEVDLLVETNQRVMAVECKMKENPNKGDLGGIHKLRDFYGDEHVSSAFVACTTPDRYIIAAGVQAISGWTTWKS